MAHAGGGPQGEPPHHQSNQGNSSRKGEAGGYRAALQQLSQEPAQGKHQGGIGHHGNPLAGHISGNKLFAVRHHAQQPFVHHHGNLLSFELAQANRNEKRKLAKANVLCKKEQGEVTLCKL